MAVQIERAAEAEVVNKAHYLIFEVAPEHAKMHLIEGYAGKSERILFRPFSNQARRAAYPGAVWANAIDTQNVGIYATIYNGTNKTNLELSYYSTPADVVQLDDQALDHIVTVSAERTQAASKAKKLVPSWKEWALRDEGLVFAKWVPQRIESVSPAGLDYMKARIDELERLIRECEPTTDADRTQFSGMQMHWYQF